MKQTKRPSSVSTFETFAKINDRHFKVVRSKPRIAPDVELPKEPDLQAQPTFGDFYSEESISLMEDNDEIEASEAAFMRGFLTA